MFENLAERNNYLIYSQNEVERVDEIEDLSNALSHANPAIDYGRLCRIEGNYYCPKCGGVRRGNLFFDAWSINDHMVALEGVCHQCKHWSYFLFYTKDGKRELAVLHDTNGGISTPHTSENVAYYLDQAFKCKSIGAYSASMAMYRAALDCLLLDIGFKGSLKDKIAKLEQMKQEEMPIGLRDLDSEMMDVIRNLGNGAIHPNDGDIAKQKLIDMHLIAVVDVVFVDLIDSVYEGPVRRGKAHRILKESNEKMKRK